MEQQAAFFIFVLVTTFTPGPNNISSANLAVLYGFKPTYRYRLGIFAGVALLMLVCAFLSGSVMQYFPAAETYLRYLGAAYIVYLALSILKTSYQIDETGQAVLHMPFLKGILLQLLNPKLLVFGITVYSTYLLGRITEAWMLPLSALLLAATALASVTLWALGGSTIGRFASRRPVRLALNGSLSLLLLFSAYQLSGLGGV